MNLEAVAPNFEIEKLLEIRKRSWEVLEEISDLLIPGVSEVEAAEQAEAILKRSQIQTKWHKTIIRFGANTPKSFREPLDAKSSLKESDIAVIDLGPV